MLPAASASGLPALLERLSERSLAKELITVFKEIVEIATEEQLKDAVGTSWVAIAAGKKVEGKGRPGIAVGANSEEGHNRKAQDLAVSEHGNTGRTTGDMEMAPDGSSEGTQRGETYDRQGRLGLVLHVQFKIARMLDAHHDTCLRWHPREQESSAAKRVHVPFTGDQEKGLMVFVEFPVRMLFETMEANL